MDPISIITSIFGTLFAPESVTKLVDQGAITSLIQGANKDTIYAICITILAYQVQDAGVRTAAINAIATLAEKGTP